MKLVLPVLMLTLLALASAQGEVARVVDPAAQQARAAAAERVKQRRSAGHWEDSGTPQEDRAGNRGRGEAARGARSAANH